MFEDVELVCKKCGKAFVFTKGEQEFFAERGLENVPVRCPECRQKRKERRLANRTMHTVVCSECGKEDEVPFLPHRGTPVYCNECFEKYKGK